MMEFGLIPILNGMCHRLSWGTISSGSCSHTSLSLSSSGSSSHGSEEDQQQWQNHRLQHNAHGSGDNGIHGPGCECNSESALW
eukprot:5857625-Ditylum_brightwellii.AAC.1